MIIKHQQFKLLEKIVLERVVFRPPLKGNINMQEEACFLHVLRGKSTLYFPNSKKSVQGLDSVLMKCGSYIQDWHKNEDGSDNEAVLIHFYPDVVQLVFDNKIPDLLAKKGIKKAPETMSVQYEQVIKSYINSLLIYFDTPSLIDEEIIKLKVRELIMLIIRSSPGEELDNMLGGLFDQNKYSFNKIIDTHLYEDLSLQDLAILTNLSLSSFKRKFTSIYSASPAKYLKEKKLEKAKTLLENTTLRMTEIAFECGLPDTKNFSRLFSSVYGLSPSEYKKSILTRKEE
ncbi:MAG: AraC family transcriptional regulator [Bacteroidia bacterium]|nr:AraC family transcriptional regulator [Bacteroidia bacterium]